VAGIAVAVVAAADVVGRGVWEGGEGRGSEAEEEGLGSHLARLDRGVEEEGDDQGYRYRC